MESPDFKFSSIKFDPVGIAKVLEREETSAFPLIKGSILGKKNRPQKLFQDLSDAVSRKQARLLFRHNCSDPEPPKRGPMKWRTVSRDWPRQPFC